MKIKSSRGFSLIEMMTVLAIVGIAASVAAPYINSFRQNTNLKEAARDISSDILYWKQRAMSDNIRYRINFDATGNQYTFMQENAPNSGVYINVPVLLPNGRLNVPGGNPKAVGAGNANIVISGTSGFILGTYIPFNPRGTTSNCNGGVNNDTCTATLKHNIRLSTADINTNLMGRVNVKYTLK